MKSNIIIFSHPVFLNSQSMPRFAQMILEGMEKRGHLVEVWSPKPFFWKIPFPQRLKKWLGYLDQFLVFPFFVRWRMLSQPVSTLYVISDQALGPWVSLVAKKPHVIHVHDFMALRSARGEFPQNPTSRSGKFYQEWIRRGFSKGKTFVCVSHKTKSDLLLFLDTVAKAIYVVHNGLNFPFKRLERDEALNSLQRVGLDIPDKGFLVHVGGNQWYKNRMGVLAIYREYAKMTPDPLPLWMIGPKPTEAIRQAALEITAPGCVHFLTGLSNEQVMASYSVARLLIFPSIAEGFGWPIAEAMACGCPVMTTNEAPMTEVGGEAACYIPAMPVGECNAAWAKFAASRVSEMLQLSGPEQAEITQMCMRHVEQFNAELTLSAYEEIYKRTQEIFLA